MFEQGVEALLLLPGQLALTRQVQQAFNLPALSFQHDGGEQFTQVLFPPVGIEFKIADRKPGQACMPGVMTQTLQQA